MERVLWGELGPGRVQADGQHTLRRPGVCVEVAEEQDRDGGPHPLTTPEETAARRGLGLPVPIAGSRPPLAIALLAMERVGVLDPHLGESSPRPAS